MTLSVLLAAIALAQAAPAVDDGLYPITGTVTDAGSGRPLARVRLTLALATGGDQHFSAVTGANGSFAFRAPAGKYHLLGERAGYPQQGLNQPPGSAFSTAVVAGSGKIATDIAFRLVPGAAISGHVVDDASDPVANAVVYALRAGVFLGRRRVWHAGAARTNGAGEYRLGAMPAGAYYIAVAAQPWFAEGLDLDEKTKEGDANIAWPLLFSGNTPDAHAAALVTVTAGGEANADFAFPAARGSTLRFHTDSKEQTYFRVSLSQRGPDGCRLPYRNDTVYGGVMRNVYPGRYEFAAGSDSGTKAWLYRVMDVTGGDVDVDLSGLAAPTISGRVQVEGEKPKEGTLFQLGLQDEIAHEGMRMVTRPDGTFDQPLFLTGGRYRVGVAGGAYRVRSIQADGAKVEGTTIDLPEPGPLKLDVVISDDVAKIEGMLHRGKYPVAGAAAMLIPRERDGVSAEDQTDSDGSFNLASLPLGDYDLLILETGEHIEYTRPEVLAPYREQLRPVHVGKRGVEKLDIDLDEPAARPAQ
jgi:hypothetical protein